MSTARTGQTVPHQFRIRTGAPLKELLGSIQARITLRVRLAGSKRDAFFVLGDALATMAACAAATVLNSRPSQPAAIMMYGIVTALLVLATNALLRNYRLAWVTFSLADLRRLFAACVLVTASLAGLRLLPAFASRIPTSPALTGIVLFLSLATFRGSKRLLVEPLFASAEGRRTLIVMSSRHAYFLPNVLRRLSNFDYNIVGIIDPNPAQVGSYEQGVEVVGTTDDIEAIVERYRAEVVMVMLADDPGFGLGDFYARLHRLGTVDVKTLPSLVDIIEDRSDLGALEKLCIHELTGRPPVSSDIIAMRRVFGSRRIMVTGAGGSIGSELCRQLARLGPESIVMFERDDSNLFYIERELRSAHPGLSAVPFLGDITRPEDIELACSRHRPHIIFHAAAYKHVPILEFHPEDAIRVNVLGTHLLARAAVRHRADCFVYISTDKAVNPTSVMGASKRLGEMLAASMNGLGELRTVAVRFGNVLDSRGSVTTVFRDAIARRQPITVTHKEMRRYLMLTSEAVLLVLQAATIGKGGEVFVLDMGNPVSIWDLAHRMVELAGLTPNRDIPIVLSGTRPGEKLFEELLTAEEGTVATENNRVFRARISQNLCYPDLIAAIHNLEAQLGLLEPDQLKQELARVVPGYLPDLCLGLEPTASSGRSVTFVRKPDSPAQQPKTGLSALTADGELGLL
ncbi:MAG: nucleoside-diphosphate sugar epimerase/dehydratase [candidate division WOR-3 bacterium]